MPPRAPPGSGGEVCILRPYCVCSRCRRVAPNSHSIFNCVNIAASGSQLRIRFYSNKFCCLLISWPAAQLFPKKLCFRMAIERLCLEKKPFACQRDGTRQVFGGLDRRLGSLCRPGSVSPGPLTSDTGKMCNYAQKWDCFQCKHDIRA